MFSDHFTYDDAIRRRRLERSVPTQVATLKRHEHGRVERPVRGTRARHSARVVDHVTSVQGRDAAHVGRIDKGNFEFPRVRRRRKSGARQRKRDTDVAKLAVEPHGAARVQKRNKYARDAHALHGGVHGLAREAAALVAGARRNLANTAERDNCCAEVKRAAKNARRGYKLEYIYVVREAETVIVLRTVS